MHTDSHRLAKLPAKTPNLGLHIGVQAMKGHRVEFEKDETLQPPLLQPERGIPPSYWVGIIGTVVIAAIGITVYLNFEPKNLPIAAPFEVEKPTEVVAETPEPEATLDAHEIAWLQNQLTQAQTFGAKLPENTQLDVANNLLKMIRYKVHYRPELHNSWPKNAEDLWQRGYGDASDYAFLIATNLLRNGFRNVGIIKAASENQADHTWVVISVNGREWYADPLYHDSLKRPEKSALTHYKVMATVHPSATKPKLDFP